MQIHNLLNMLENVTDLNENIIIEVTSFIDQLENESQKLEAIKTILQNSEISQLDILLKEKLMLMMNNHKCDIKKPFIFISYSSKDWKFVYPSALKYQLQGINVWIDIELENYGGEKWNKIVKQTLVNHQLKLVIFFMSGHSFISVPIFQELMFSKKDRYAGGPNKSVNPPIIPINIIPDLQYLDDFVNDVEYVELTIQNQKDVFELYKKYIDADMEDDFYMNISSHFIAWTIYEQIFNCSNDVKYLNGFSDHDIRNNNSFTKACINQEITYIEPISKEVIKPTVKNIEKPVVKETSEPVIQKTSKSIIKSTSNPFDNPIYYTEHLLDGVNKKDYEAKINEYNNSEHRIFKFLYSDPYIYIIEYIDKGAKCIKIPDYVRGFSKNSTPFKNVVNLKEIKLGKGLRNVNNMFRECPLTYIDLSNWDVSKIEYFIYFVQDSNLTSIGDLSKWDVSSAVSTNSMFAKSKLIDLGNLDNWNISNVKNMGYMFTDSEIINIGDISKWNTSNVNGLFSMFENTKLTHIGDISNWDVSNVNCFSYMFNESKIHSLGDLGSWDMSNAVEIFSMFSNSQLEFIGDLSRWNTSNVNSLNSLFKNTISTNIGNLSNWNTSKVKNLNNMFHNSLIHNAGDLSNWDTSNVEQSVGTFRKSSLIDAGNLGKWNMSKNKSINAMFYQSKLSSIGDVSNWDVSNVTDFGFLFAETRMGMLGKLIHWNMSNATKMYNMFSLATVLDIGDISNWDVSNVEDMSSLFKGSNLTYVGDLSKWNIKKLGNPTSTFKDCKIKKYF